MTTFSNFEAMAEFSQEILDKIIAEGEQKLAAQLQVAIAADQRALVFAGFQVASLTVVTGGIAALINNHNPDILLISLAIFFLIGLLAATFIAIDTVRPALFSFPGNCPENWLVENWMTPSLSYSNATERRASVEQVYVLNQSIKTNERDMEQRAKKFQLAIDLTIWTIAASALLLVGLFVWREIAV